MCDAAEHPGQLHRGVDGERHGQHSTPRPWVTRRPRGMRSRLRNDALQPGHSARQDGHGERDGEGESRCSRSAARRRAARRAVPSTKHGHGRVDQVDRDVQPARAGPRALPAHPAEPHTGWRPRSAGCPGPPARGESQATPPSCRQAGQRGQQQAEGTSAARSPCTRRGQSRSVRRVIARPAGGERHAGEGVVSRKSLSLVAHTWRTGPPARRRPTAAPAVRPSAPPGVDINR
jgi:hypothetical protein